MSLFGRSAGTDDWLAAPQGCKERLLLYSWLTIPCPPLVGLLFRQNLIQVTALLCWDVHAVQSNGSELVLHGTAEPNVLVVILRGHASRKVGSFVWAEDLWLDLENITL